MSKKKIGGDVNISGCHGNVKNDGHIFNMSKFPRRMNEQLLNVSAPSSESSLIKPCTSDGYLLLCKSV